jgi:hypothetical protein
MKIGTLISAVGTLAFCCAWATAADLSTIDRTVAKEPAYKSKPWYCLLVFGQEAKTKVWLVLDGDVLYVDRNGNGDLTEEGERVPRTDAHKTGTSSEFVFREMHYYRAGDITEQGGLKYTGLTLVHGVPNKNFVPSPETAEEWNVLLKRHPEGVPGSVRILIDGKYSQNAGPPFADRPQDAPIIHFNGPLRLEPEDGSVLTRGAKPGELQVRLGTPGLGKKYAFAARTYQGVPEDIHPLAEIEFPNKHAGGKPITIRVKLEQRC